MDSRVKNTGFCAVVPRGVCWHTKLSPVAGWFSSPPTLIFHPGLLQVAGVEDLDATHLIQSHADYPHFTGRILDLVDLADDRSRAGS